MRWQTGASVAGKWLIWNKSVRYIAVAAQNDGLLFDLISHVYEVRKRWSDLKAILCILDLKSGNLSIYHEFKLDLRSKV